MSTTRLSDVLSEFARTLLTDSPVQVLLDDLVRHTVDLLPIDAAGVSLISRHARPRMVAGSDPLAKRLEELQTELDGGPCTAAVASDDPILVPDLAADTRFPEFAARAQESGLAAVFAFPMRSQDRRVGALDLYRYSAGPLDPEDVAVARTLADVATVYIVSAEARTARTEFVASVSHELRTPMTSIAGYAEVLREGEAGALTPHQQKIVDSIDRNSRRATALAADLLLIASLESRDPRPHVEVDLANVVKGARDALAASIAERSVTVDFSSTPGSALVDGVVEDLERMLVNLVGNALKFTADGGWVRCTVGPVAAAPELVRIEVADNGLGIPVAEQPELFTRFFRSTTAESHLIPGTGLGLSIVAAIVRQHGGTVRVRSAHLEGSTFTVDLPRTRSWGMRSHDPNLDH